ncbi:unnamed protein product, partial [Oikopleura dioica]
VFVSSVGATMRSVPSRRAKHSFCWRNEDPAFFLCFWGCSSTVTRRSRGSGSGGSPNTLGKLELSCLSSAIIAPTVASEDSSSEIGERSISLRLTTPSSFFRNSSWFWVSSAC